MVILLLERETDLKIVFPIIRLTLWRSWSITSQHKSHTSKRHIHCQHTLKSEKNVNSEDLDFVLVTFSLWDKIPDAHKLGEERFISTHSLQKFRSVRGWPRGRQHGRGTMQRSSSPGRVGRRGHTAASLPLLSHPGYKPFECCHLDSGCDLPLSIPRNMTDQLAN